MQIWNLESESFVDFVDGYSYLHFLPDTSGWSKEEIDPADLSTLFHEFTHQLALQGWFGPLCAYFQALRYLARTHAGLHAYAENPDWARGDTSEEDQKWLRYEQAWNLYTIYSDPLANYQDLMGTYRWLLEGLALYVQLDFQPSAEYEMASDLYRLAQEFVRTEILKGTEQPFDAQLVYKLFADVKASKYSSGVLESLLMGGASTESIPYFFGYLMVRQLQRCLVEKDSRLVDQEIFFTFVNSYFFRDRSLTNLATCEPREHYQKRLDAFLAERVTTLLDVDPARLRLAVDTLCHYPNTEVNFGSVDFATLLRAGVYEAWQDPEQVAVIRRNIYSCATAVLEQPVFANSPIFEALQATAVQATDTALKLFDVLTGVMLAFKLKHTETAVLGYKQREDYTWVVLANVRGGSIQGLSFRSSDFKSIAEYAERGDFAIAGNTKAIMPPGLYEAWRERDYQRFERILNQYYREGRLVLLNEYDAYLISGQERCHIYVGNGFIDIKTYSLQVSGETAVPLPLRVTGAEEMLKSLGERFYHGAYLSYLRVPEFEDGPRISQDTVFQHEAMWRIWRALYPDGLDADDKLSKFGLHKASLAVVGASEEALLEALCTAEFVEEYSEADVASINQEWRACTGRNLIRVSRVGSKLAATLDI